VKHLGEPDERIVQVRFDVEGTGAILPFTLRGFRVQDNVQAKTTSTNYTVRTVYLMLSTFLYNVWVIANVILADMLGIVEPKRPLMKLSRMVRLFTVWIERPGDPPR